MGLAHAQHLNKGLAKGLDDVQDLPVQVIRLKEGAPPRKDGMCDLQHTICNPVVGFREAADEVLGEVASVKVVR